MLCEFNELYFCEICQVSLCCVCFSYLSFIFSSDMWPSTHATFIYFLMVMIFWLDVEIPRVWTFLRIRTFPLTMLKNIVNILLYYCLVNFLANDSAFILDMKTGIELWSDNIYWPLVDRIKGSNVLFLQYEIYICCCVICKIS